jgi:hypothetical protein
MKTTELIIEVFVGGTLVMVAILYGLWNYFPTEIEQFIQACKDRLFPSFGLIVPVVLASWAYSMGIVAEFSARIVSEWRLNQIKFKRLKEFLKDNKSVLRQDPILQRVFNPEPGKGHVEDITDQQVKGITKEQATRIVGLMRFQVMRTHPDLSKEVESHVKRMRVLRVLALVELLFLVGLCRHLWYTCSLLLLVGLLVLLVLCFTLYAVNDRFDRYCRAIERSYLLLATC